MMKKILTLIATGAVVTAAQGAPLTPEQALQRAEQQDGMRAPAESALTLRRTINTGSQQPAVYLFGNADRMLVVAADDAVTPVLGYIDGETSGDIPPQMEWWLGEYARQIEYLRAEADNDTGLKISPMVTEARAKARADRAPIAPMVATAWNQDAPYNNLCPTIGGRRTYTGCVATAAAQVMKYFNWPDQGTGSITYSDNGTSRSLDFSAQTFDWNNMRNTYNYNYSYNQQTGALVATPLFTDVQATAVATLMRACGYAAQMNYGTEASGAQSSEMLRGAQLYLKYNEAAQNMSRDFFQLDQWEEMVYNNLASVGPVYYSGDNGSEGHAFVCDGYSSDGYFHFNWGWGGAYDGYFRLDALVPEGQGIGGNTGGFNFGQEAFLNFTKPGATLIDIPELAPVTQYGNLSATVSGNSLLFTTDQAVNAPYCYNSTGNSQRLVFAMKVYTADGLDVYYGRSTTASTFEPNSGPVSQLLSLPSRLFDGEYLARPVVKIANTDEWLEFNAYYYNVSYVNITVANGRITSVSTPTPGSVEASDLAVSTAVAMGSYCRYSFTANNPGSIAVSEELTPYLAIMSGSSMQAIGVGTAFSVTLQPGETKEYTFDTPITPGSGYSSYTGSAYFCLIDKNMSVVEYIPVTVVRSTGSVTATAFSFVGNAQQAIADNLQFSCGVRATGSFAKPLYVAITDQTYGNVLATFETEPLYLSSGETKTFTVAGGFGEATVGQSYTAHFCYMDSYGLNAMRSINFTIGAMTSGIESAGAGSTEVEISRAGDVVAVSAPSEIASVEVYGIDGRRLTAAASLTGTTAELSGLPEGIMLVKVTLADGTVKVAKLVR